MSLVVSEANQITLPLSSYVIFSSRVKTELTSVPASPFVTSTNFKKCFSLLFHDHDKNEKHKCKLLLETMLAYIINENITRLKTLTRSSQKSLANTLFKNVAYVM